MISPATAYRRLSVAVLGAGGTIAPAIVHDLAASEEVADLRLLDLDETRAQAVADAHGGACSSVAAVDARDPQALASALGGSDVLVNTASYRINLEAMRACLSAGCHYLDLGGLYWMTGRQLELSDQFERAGLLGVVGIGSSPGKTNLMAARAVRELGGLEADIETIDVFAGGRDLGAPADGVLRAPYALQTLLDELTLPPVVLRAGQPEEIEPLSDGGRVDYGEPIGEGETIYTLHSELVSFGESFGAREVSFRLSLAPAVLSALKRLVGASQEEIAAAGREAASPSTETVSVHLVRVTASGDDAVVVRAVSRPHFGLGGSIVSTAAPIAAAVRLLARGAISGAGVHSPERCIEPDQMFSELEQRGCRFSVTRC
ncbi:MAG: saccharopine dehydrogenase family protein [Solirubrobacteraceae bacterium]